MATPLLNLHAPAINGTTSKSQMTVQRPYAYVATDTSDDMHVTPHHDDEPRTAREVLTRVDLRMDYA